VFIIVIEHFGDIQPGTKCSAIFFDTKRIRREQEFDSKLYSENGVHDAEIGRAIVPNERCALKIPTAVWIVIPSSLKFDSERACTFTCCPDFLYSDG
jgi:hypothetical protein